MADDRYRLDQLAAAAGVASTTVRLYQNRGLLDPPDVVGRTGYYGPGHLARLRLIARLQREGHSLAGIGSLLDMWQSGAGLSSLVGTERHLQQLLDGPEAIELSPVELAQRFPADALTPAAMARAVELGLVTLTGTGAVRVADPRFVDAGPALAALGVPVTVILDEWDALSRTMADVAERFVALFERYLAPAGMGPAGSDTVSLDEQARTVLAEQLETLRAAASQVVAAALDGALADAGRRRLGALVSAAKPPAAPSAQRRRATPPRPRRQQHAAAEEQHRGELQQPGRSNSGRRKR